MIEAASKKLDIVWERLWNYGVQPFKFHVNNTCYKSYTHIKSLKKLQVRKLYSQIKTFLFSCFFICVFNSKISAIEFYFSVCRFVINWSSNSLDNILVSLKSVSTWTNKHTNSVQCENLYVDVQSCVCYFNFKRKYLSQRKACIMLYPYAPLVKIRK